MRADRSRPKSRAVAGRASVWMLVLIAPTTGCGRNEPAPPTGAGRAAEASSLVGARREPLPSSAQEDAEGSETDSDPPPRGRAVSRTGAVAADQVARGGAGVTRGIPSFAPPPKHDESALAERGIYRSTSERLVLYSDLAPERLVGLGEAVDQLFEEWVRYFLLDGGQGEGVGNEAGIRNALSGWKVTGYVMRDAELFGRLGLLPTEVGTFPNARSRVIVQRSTPARSGQHVSRIEFWMHDQQDDYYRRHLLLHEATHCFVDSVVGKPNATWYAEGVAELFATHVAADPEAAQPWRFRAMPRDNDEVPGWGRIPLIQEAVARGRGLSMAGVREAPADEFLETEWYAWCWALTTFLDSHPRYRERFQRLLQGRQDTGIDELFEQRYGEDALAMEEEWQLFVANLEYGYDIERAVIDFREGQSVKAGTSAEARVAADRGWQNTGVWVESGRRYQVRTDGRYSLADEPKTWWCESQGISFRYYEGKPLGRLVGAVHSRARFVEEGTSRLLYVLDVGDEAVLMAEHDGTLYLRVNDAWGELGDNRGAVQVTIEAVR